jgi:hypothetical protein
MFPSLRGRIDLAFTDPAQAPLDRCDVVFFATPHGVAMAQARELVTAGVKLIDLAADFRLKDPAVFAQWYGMPHTCPDLLAESVYGLPEVNREAVRQARIVGNPPKITTWIDGVKFMEWTETEKRLGDKGGIALQVHGGGDLTKQFVRYRNIRIKRLDKAKE